MPCATLPFHNRIVIVFDFDLTLGKGSVDVLVEKLGEDPRRFREQCLEQLERDGWDQSLARFHALIELSRRTGCVIDEALLRTVGRETPLYDGVPALFDRVREAARAVVADVEIEFYVLTAGFAEVPSATPIAGEFSAIWGSRCFFGDDGGLKFAKSVITYPEKVRYLLQLAKGLRVEGPDGPADVWRDVPARDWHVPFDQMIYLGDGASDLPAFDLLEDRGGIALGVFRPDASADEWRRGKQLHAERRVQNLAAADFSEGSELLRSLLLAVDSIADKVALRRLARGK